MPLPNVEQLEIIYINENLRLRKYDGNYEIALQWYQDPDVYINSEGIFDSLKIPDLDYVKRMYTWLNNNRELFFIEVLENDKYLPLGDITIKEENPPITIGVKKYRGKGLGKLVMKAIIDRLRVLGCKKIYNSIVYKWNIASQKLHKSLGFVCAKETENEYFYELDLLD